MRNVRVLSNSLTMNPALQHRGNTTEQRDDLLFHRHTNTDTMIDALATCYIQLKIKTGGCIKI